MILTKGVVSIKCVKRGEIYYILPSPAVGHEQAGKRPAIIISNNLGNIHSPVVEIIFITTKCKKSLPTHVVIYSSKRKSVALCEQVTTIDKSRILNYIGKVTEDELEKINQAIKISLGMEETNMSMNNELTMIENELVPVYETSTGEKVVYGTELHEVLGVKSNYREWVKRRLIECDATDKEDFQAVEISTPSGQTKNEHIIQLDTAKEMAMLERNEQGKKVRRYFIKIEKKYKANYDDLSTELKAVIIVDKRITKVENKVDTVKQELEDFKQDLPILGVEEGKITSAVRKKGVYCLGGKDSNAYKDKSLRGKVYSDLHRQIKRQFGVSTYKAVKRNQCDLVIQIIETYEPPIILAEQIKDYNNQLNMS